MRPTLEEVQQISRQGGYRCVPVSMEILSDFITPIEALRRLKNVSNHCYILESVESQEKFGRYTFLGYDPMVEISCLNGRMKVEDLTVLPDTHRPERSGAADASGAQFDVTGMETSKEQAQKQMEGISRHLPEGSSTASYARKSAASPDGTFPVQHPGEVIRSILKDFKAPQLSFLPSFSGGLVGYFSYDYMKYAEPSLRLDAQDSEHFQDVDLMLFDKVICFDHFSQKIVLIVNMFLPDPAAEDASAGDTFRTTGTGTIQQEGPDQPHSGAVSTVAGEYQKAEQILQSMADLLKYGQPAKEKTGTLLSDVRPLFDREAYMAMVEKAKEHIREGDIFQIVLSNRLEADFEGSLFDTYRILRTLNPSPYMFYFSGTDVETAGASPETLVKLEDGVLHTFPLAGTRPRGKTEAEDKALEEGLLADPKELAEHNMLVDLGRNDIGKISKFGTVKVEQYHQILKYSHVMHIGSTVCGKIRDDLDALDAVDSILPAGTLSGAPKLKACQLINDLENNKRGIYGGAIGYLDFGGNLDTCIGIRLAYHKNGKVFVRSGAGIVADSVPEKEYQECINKAQAVVTALHMAADM